MEIVERQVDGVVILDLKGALVHGNPVDLLLDAITRNLDAGRTKIVVNMEDAKATDTVGADALRRCQTEAALRRAAIRLLKAGGLKNTALVSRLAQSFYLYADEGEAVKSFVYL